jgi:hypothetical protein
LYINERLGLYHQTLPDLFAEQDVFGYESSRTLALAAEHVVSGKKIIMAMMGLAADRREALLRTLAIHDRCSLEERHRGVQGR